jgi:two-component system nitrogen regulation response regulator GlnG
MSRKLLVIDDDPTGSRLIQAIFAPEGFEVLVALDGRSGLAQAAENRPDAVLLDLQLPDLEGLEVLERLKSAQPDLPVLMLTAHGEVQSAVRAIQLGAFDYLAKPIDADQVLVAVRRALETRELRRDVEDLRRRLVEGGGLAEQMGPSAQMQQVIDQVKSVAPSNFSVLIQGETGSGKELVAQALHRQSERHRRPFVAIDCGAIPESLVESELFGHERGAFTGADKRLEGRLQVAEGGTLLLDEVGNLPLALQSKLLRVLESKEVHALGAARASRMDVRFLAATNVELTERVKNGGFRADLYFRLAQYTILLPPLRQRPVDIPYLAQRFLEEAALELRRPVEGFAPEALDLLARHSWPGNVRELRNVVRHAVLSAEYLTVREPLVRTLLGAPGAQGRADETAVDGSLSLREIAVQAAHRAERQAITDTLRATRGNKSAAARLLRTDYKTLHLKLKLFGIRARDFSP